ncbi:MAG: zinc-ribbon domain-containing protein [Gammaproteobacteria bacterium]|nr:zinc-ribbon domain-containing protein [Gammaproteobacteria bacterium]
MPYAYEMTALESVNGDEYRTRRDDTRARYCKNGIDWNNCNWLIPADSEYVFCPSCELNETIPDLSIPDNLTYWRTLEQGKRRLVYSLMRLWAAGIQQKRDQTA